MDKTKEQQLLEIIADRIATAKMLTKEKHASEKRARLYRRLQQATIFAGIAPFIFLSAPLHNPATAAEQNKSSIYCDGYLLDNSTPRGEFISTSSDFSQAPQNKSKLVSRQIE